MVDQQGKSEEKKQFNKFQIGSTCEGNLKKEKTEPKEILRKRLKQGKTEEKAIEEIQNWKHKFA